MNWDDYKSDVFVTEGAYAKPCATLNHSGTARLLHATMGLSTEANEALDAMKKHVFYGKELDRVNLKEEIGDMLWYLAILMDELELSLEECQRTNIAKLRTRYPERFDPERAIERDLEAEREVLESMNKEKC